MYTKAEHKPTHNPTKTTNTQLTKTTNPQNQQIHSPTKPATARNQQTQKQNTHQSQQAHTLKSPRAAHKKHFTLLFWQASDNIFLLGHRARQGANSFSALLCLIFVFLRFVAWLDADIFWSLGKRLSWFQTRLLSMLSFFFSKRILFFFLG